MILSREFFAKFVEAQVTSLADLQEPVFKHTDQSADVFVGAFKLTQISIAAAGSLVLTLPDGYVSTSKALVIIRSPGVVKVTVASPDHTTSVALIYGTAAQPGHYSIVDTLTSVTVANPTAGALTIKAIIVTLPDLTEADSYLDNNLATGVNPQ